MIASAQSTRSKRPSAQRGFALLITITLVSFLVLILVSLATLTRVETQVATNSQSLGAARQNALYALNIAIGELQKYAGPDQRVTAPATTVYPEKDVTTGTGDLYDDPTYGYRTLAQTSSARSYLTRVETYLTPDERTNWDEALKQFWNSSNYQPHYTAVFDSSLRVDRATNPIGTPAVLNRQEFGDANGDGTYGETGDYDTIFGEFQRDQVPVWLVSGLEKYLIDQETGTITTTSGNIVSTAQYEADISPIAALPDPDPTDPTNDSIWLVSTNSATVASASVDGLDGRVKVRKQAITGPTVLSTTDQTVGHYAWWVGDESQKANFAVRDPYSDESLFPEGSIEYRNRLQVPQRLGWERMAGFSSSGIDPNSEDFLKVVTTAQIPYVDPTLVDDPNGTRGPVPRNFHNLTAFSKSLLTDTALGGLKKDMTRILEDDDGPDDADPIADYDRYDSDDARFGAWGGSNGGFPSANTAQALDGIPTWGQLRKWYAAEASAGGGPITPDAEAGIGPVLTYVMFNGGWSYSGSGLTRTIRWHWMPCIVLWNPYDVGLNAADYDIEMEFSPALWKGYVCKPNNATLAELQAASGPAADWRSFAYNVPGASSATPLSVVGPNGKNILVATKVGSNLIVEEFKTTTPVGSVTIFKYWKTTGSFAGSDFPGSDDVDRYFVKMTGDPDSYNITKGPWVGDTDDSADANDGPVNGLTDAFGRLFYGLKSADASTIFFQQDNANFAQPLGPRKAAYRLAPHGIYGDPATKRPLARPMQFRLSGSFSAGQAKVFTLDSDQQWIKGTSLPLVNDYDAQRPYSMWFDVMEVVNGPLSAAADGLRWMFQDVAGGSSFANPKVTIKLNNKTLFEAEAFGDLIADKSWFAAMGRDYRDFAGYGTNSGQDADGDGTINRDETEPKFVSQWRPLYDFGPNFTSHLKTQSGSETTASNWAYGKTWIQPLTGVGGYGQDNVHKYISAFSRFNFAAPYMDSHPLFEVFRSQYAFNNFDASGNKEGLTKLFPIRQQQDENYGNSTLEVKWDDNQASGTDGYALITPRNTDFVSGSSGAFYEGKTNLSVRNAKRAQSEILSIGQLQQVNLSRYFWQPAFPIGNSFAPPYTDREAIAGINSRPVGTDKNPTGTYQGYSKQSNTDYPKPGVRANNADMGIRRFDFSSGTRWIDVVTPGNTMMDLSYLLNENLWDRFFLSTVTTTPDLLTPLPNSRLRITASANDVAAGAVEDYDTASAYLENVGALNINSTSVEAWKALITAFRDLKLGNNPSDTVPVARTLDPIEDSVEFTFDGSLTPNISTSDIGAINGAKDYTKPISGFRYLTDGMVQTLAERIVDEVRLRGPFYSLADFVNRRLVAPSGSNSPGTDWYIARTDGKVNEPNNTSGDNQTDFMNPSYDPFIGLQGLAGSLQRAIQVSGINGGVNSPELGPSGSGTSNRYDMIYTARIRLGTGPADADYVNNGAQNWGGANAIGGYTSNNASKHTQEPTMRSHLDTEHLVGAPAGEAGQLFDGTPGFVTQGDLLAMIGPALTPRGDTFLIRTYGDAINPATGELNGRAWLEAVVQRVTEPVTRASSDPADPDYWNPADAFGRKFKVVSFRWLSEDEL